VARASDSQPELLTVEVLPERSRDLRDLWGFFRNRRPDAYGALVEPISEPGGLSESAYIVAER
jgi:hypothetical protein